MHNINSKIKKFYNTFKSSKYENHKFPLKTFKESKESCDCLEAVVCGLEFLKEFNPSIYLFYNGEVDPDDPGKNIKDSHFALIVKDADSFCWVETSYKGAKGIYHSKKLKTLVEHIKLKIYADNYIKFNYNYKIKSDEELFNVIFNQSGNSNEN